MKTSVCLSLLFLLAACHPNAEVADTAAPTARKPSYFESDKRQAATPVKTQTPALPAIRSRADFDLLSRVYEQDSEYEIPHLLFLIDREDNNRTDYINTPKYRLHENYLAEILKPMPTRKELFEQYRSPNRRFLFGTISWQNSTQEYVYEFWEGDKITPELLKLAEGRLKDSFFAPLRYKTNSLWQETVAAQSKVPFVTQESLIQNFPYLPLHRGKAVGTLRVITQEDDLYDVGADDIIILKEVPLVLPPVAGIISEKPSTALSHVNVLARGWGIPNIYLKDAEKILAPYIGRRIELTADAKQNAGMAHSSSRSRNRFFRRHCRTLRTKSGTRHRRFRPASRRRLLGISACRGCRRCRSRHNAYCPRSGLARFYAAPNLSATMPRRAHTGLRPPSPIDQQPRAKMVETNLCPGFGFESKRTTSPPSPNLPQPTQCTCCEPSARIARLGGDALANGQNPKIVHYHGLN